MQGFYFFGFIFINNSYKYKYFRKQGKNTGSMDFEWVQPPKDGKPDNLGAIASERNHERSISNPKAK